MFPLSGPGTRCFSPDLLFIGDISKSGNGKIQYIIRYAITFDKDLTPKEQNGISYGEIKSGNRPIFYFIYINLQYMLNFLKANDTVIKNLSEYSDYT